MSTHNICFDGEIRKILCGYPLLYVAMTYLRTCAASEDSGQPAQSDQNPHWTHFL